MKLTKSQLKQLIKEELGAALNEAPAPYKNKARTAASQLEISLRNMLSQQGFDVNSGGGERPDGTGEWEIGGTKAFNDGSELTININIPYPAAVAKGPHGSGGVQSVPFLDYDPTELSK